MSLFTLEMFTLEMRAKNTKEFANGWIGKLKKDQADAGAESAVLMTGAMPREVRDFDYIDDVWITNE